MKWFLFTSLEKGQAADLKIAQNMTAMFPQNPQEHYSTVNPLKNGGVFINNVLCTHGFTEVSEAEGFTPEQVQIYLNGIDGDNIVEVDTIAEYTPEWFDWE